NLAARLALGDLAHPAPGRDTFIGPRQIASVRKFVALLDEQPILALFSLSRPHTDQDPGAFHTLAGKPELELSRFEPLVGIALRLPDPPIPQHHRPATVMALGDRAFE